MRFWVIFTLALLRLLSSQVDNKARSTILDVIAAFALRHEEEKGTYGTSRVLRGHAGTYRVLMAETRPRERLS